VRFLAHFPAIESIRGQLTPLLPRRVLEMAVYHITWESGKEQEKHNSSEKVERVIKKEFPEARFGGSGKIRLTQVYKDKNSTERVALIKKLA
jgi:hypothetical protein